MEVLGKFGINPVLLVAQIVNFLIIFFIVKKYALGPILTMLKNREKTIKEGLQQAEEARKLLEESTEKERALLKKAHAEAKELVAEAKKQRDELLTRTEAQTKEQTEKLLKEAREQIAFETREAEKRLAAHVNDIAIQLLQKSTSELFTEKEQTSIMEKALKELKKKAD